MRNPLFPPVARKPGERAGRALAGGFFALLIFGSFGADATAETPPVATQASPRADHASATTWVEKGPKGDPRSRSAGSGRWEDAATELVALRSAMGLDISDEPRVLPRTASAAKQTAAPPGLSKALGPTAAARPPAARVDDYVQGDWIGPAVGPSGGLRECDSCSQPWHGCLWVEGDYLLWWTDRMQAPPLVTTSPANTAPDVAGVLGRPGTEILFGSDKLDTGPHSGGRIALGWWYDPCLHAFQGSYLGLGQRSARFRATSAEIPILARPVFDTQTGADAAMLVSHPDFLTGSIAVEASTELQSAEVLWRSRLLAECGTRLDFLIGYRFARLDESLRVDQFSEWTAPQGNIVVGTTKELFDRFETENQFHGGQFGLAYERSIGCWSLEVLMKLGLGNNRTDVRIDGATVNSVPDAGSATFAGGLLAQSTNIGQYERNNFAVVPELGVTLARELTCGMRFTLGYNLLYWTAVARPAEQIDLDVSQFPPEPPAGAQQPEFQFTSGTFWAQGLHCGLEYRF